MAHDRGNPLPNSLQSRPPVLTLHSLLPARLALQPNIHFCHVFHPVRLLLGSARIPTMAAYGWENGEGDRSPAKHRRTQPHKREHHRG